MSKFMSGDDDAGKSAGVFDDGHAVHLLEALVDDAGPADVGEPGGAAVALAVPTFTSTHVKPENLLNVAFSLN